MRMFLRGAVGSTEAQRKLEAKEEASLGLYPTDRGGDQGGAGLGFGSACLQLSLRALHSAVRITEDSKEGAPSSQVAQPHSSFCRRGMRCGGDRRDPHPLSSVLCPSSLPVRAGSSLATSWALYLALGACDR